VSLADFIKELLSYEEYAFSWDELVRATAKNWKLIDFLHFITG